MPGKNVTTISICLPADLREDVRAAAEEEGRSVSGWIVQAIRRRLQHRGAADVVEVRHGHFGKLTSPFTAPCSECGTSMNTNWHYCPNCGARIDGGPANATFIRS